MHARAAIGREEAVGQGACDGGEGLERGVQVRREGDGRGRDARRIGGWCRAGEQVSW